MHYGGDDGTTADDETDKQLPFHNPVHPCLSVVYFPLVQNVFIFIPPESIAIQHKGYLQHPEMPGYISSLLRPPLFS